MLTFVAVAAIMSFSSKKKERVRPRFLPGALQRGAISWQVVLDDSGQAALVDCYLGISTDTLVLIEERSREIVFVMPCKAILGWFTQTNGYGVIYIRNFQSVVELGILACSFPYCY
jgi:signal-induced proliferation-associated 1 like protein 1